MIEIPKSLLTYLEKAGYEEQSPKDWFIYNNGSSEIAVDCRGDGLPTVGVLINGVIQETETGIDDKLNDIRIKVLSFYPKNGAGNRSNEGKKESSKKKEEEPAPQPNQWKCGKCGTMNGEILDFCKDCGTAKMPEKSLADEAKPEPPQWNCSECMQVTDKKQADETASKYLRVLCEDCERKLNEKPVAKEADVVGPDPTKFSEVPAHTSTLLNLIKSYVGNDVLEVFGDSGTGKSKFALELARQTIAAGKTVYYLDTERNLTERDIAILKGCQYKYTPVIAEIGQLTRQLPKVDVVIIDSIGFPVLTAYARMSMKQKGDALLNLIAIFGDLKEWAYRNNGVAVVINQPESDFNKEPGHLIRPFGDKSQFAAKEIWKTEIIQRGKITKTAINAFRSRSIGHGTKIADMEVSDKGVMIKQAQEVGK